MVKLALAVAALAFPTVALAPAGGAPSQTAAPASPAAPPDRAVAEGEAVAGVRPTIAERFPNLDAYLAFLEKRSQLDGAWYRQVRPGVYELQTGNLRLSDSAKRQRIFTREELEKKFGFSR